MIPRSGRLPGEHTKRRRPIGEVEATRKRDMRKKLGLIVNPVAGMGGTVGLKGSDGEETLNRAIELGAVPQSPRRSMRALEGLIGLEADVDVITYPDDMGENEARTFGFSTSIIGSIERERTTPADTRNAAGQMVEAGVDLLLFAGGDGTARDIYDAVESRTPALGIPAGVKIHSAVFGMNPRSAGELARLFLTGQTSDLREAEVMDIDEEAVRAGRVTAELYGYLKVPFSGRLVQSLKSGSVTAEGTVLRQIAMNIVDNMTEDCCYIIGPGTTTRPIMELLGLQNTLLGVDVVLNEQVVANDVSESQILRIIADRDAKIVVTTIGGQGYVFGRGNQQLSPKVIRQVGKENIIIVSTKEKIAGLGGNPLLVDTGDDDVNNLLCGYYRVVVSYNDTIMCKVVG